MRNGQEPPAYATASCALHGDCVTRPDPRRGHDAAVDAAWRARSTELPLTQRCGDPRGPLM